MKIHFITQGCSANQADSEIMQGLLKEKGNSIVDNTEEADLVVFNSCTVKGKTESFFKKKMNELKSANKKVIIAGCIPQSEKNLNGFNNYSKIGTYQIDKINEVVNQTINGNVVSFLERENKSRLNLPKIRKNNLIEIVPISQGCLSACSFCKTKHARGQLFSYQTKDIVRHISNSVKEGIKEVWLTSQDSSAYGDDINSNIAELLKEIVEIPRNFKLRLGMANPLFFNEFLDDLIEVFKNDKIYKFLHVPLQSGNDEILENMKRGYKVKDFLYLVNRFRKEIPNLNLATDIICGYPTETKEQFNDTLNIIKQVKPDIINISRFWPRQGTLAFKLKPIDGRELKRRTRDLTKLFHEIALKNNKKWINWKGKVLISELGKNNTFLGRNFAYKQVVVKGNDLLGKEVDVEIKNVTSFDLRS